MTGEFDEEVGVRIPKRFSKAYIKAGLSLIGFPDVAALMETNANAASQLIRDRLTSLNEYSVVDLDCEKSGDKLISGAMQQWKKHSSELGKEIADTRQALRLVR